MFQLSVTNNLSLKTNLCCTSLNLRAKVSKVILNIKVLNLRLLKSSSQDLIMRNNFVSLLPNEFLGFYKY